ncbi:ribosomal L1 domain-containing protein 1 [Rhinophrynus dorsalis]
MAEPESISLDSAQVKKAIQALLAYQKTKDGANSLLLNEHDRISLMLTVWRIPRCDKTIRIPLPHGIRPESCEVCLFTRDEPDMSYEQTEKFYKKLLSQHGVTQITEVIPLKKLKKEYKPFEAKRRLLGSFDLFLSDDRIRRFLPSLLGKHFYKAKREPQSVNLKSKNLAAELNRYIQGTQLHLTNKGCCYAIRVGHVGMKVDDIVENTAAIAKVIAEKLPMKWKNVKVLHMKTQSSVALPVYNSTLMGLKGPDPSDEQQMKKKYFHRMPKELDKARLFQEAEDSLLAKKFLIPGHSTFHYIFAGLMGLQESGLSSAIVQGSDFVPLCTHLLSYYHDDDLGWAEASFGWKQKLKKKKKGKSKSTDTDVTSDAAMQEADETSSTEGPVISKEEEEDEEVPQLIPIQEPITPKTAGKEKTKVRKTPGKKSKAAVKDEDPTDGKENTVSTPKTAGHKRKVTSEEKAAASETPRKQKKDSSLKSPVKEQESLPKRSVNKKTPKKAGKSVEKLTKSAKKAFQTPKLKQSKKMKKPQSV